ncbi:TPA: SDR family oxidoreductase [Streptococcus agalactiae]|uniref:SDR family oxidoreductase n=1 Tax=Streptococcus dysgalactiae subsp. equisimilis TaxID=119602 RepID=A0AB38Y2W5_STREQ|nr:MULTISPECIES: SDR family oxidoreductase [Streptococcus]MDU3799677.1 SDR family oxidoreductase [Streptococcus sp.]WHM79672.1 SDR family oxidoreductase [Streptococcus dysgalactiae subsp. equisimilis]HEN8854415.1 SDR family oxidoreductase [Streptococcus agalactiae]
MNIQKNITKTVLVTGSSKGIGKQIAQDFEKNGHTVIYHGSSNSSFEKFNCKKTILDLRDTSNVVKWYSDIFKEYNGIDVLILNAGIGVPETDIFDVNSEYLDDLIKVNMISQIYIATQHLKLVQQYNITGTCIIFISSNAGIYPRSKFPLYSMTKNAIAYYLEILSKEFSKHRTRINIVAPGSIKTEMTDNAISNFSKENNVSDKEAEIRLYSHINSMKRMGSVKEVSDLVQFLASDKASFINGEIIKVNGGYYFE